MNARITLRSFKRWGIFLINAKKIFRLFDICLSSNKKSSQYLRLLGAKKIKNIGNLNFPYKGENGKYNTNTILDLDYWVLMPRNMQ